MGNRDVFFYSRVLFWGFGISLILNLTGTGFWISELLGALISFVILLSVKKVNRSKLFKKISGFIFAFFATIILVNMGGTMYLRQTPQFVLAILPIIVGFMLSQSKESAYNRVVLLLFIFSIFMFFFAGAILSPSLKPANALPLSFNFLNILKGTLIFVLTSITPVLCLNDFDDKKSLLTYYSTSTITVIAMSLLIVMVLGNQEAMLYRYPEFVLFKRIKIYEFFSNVENLFVIMIVTDFITTIGAGLKNMELNGKIKPTVVIILLCLLTSICCSHTNIMTTFYFYYPYILMPLLIVTLFPKRKSYKKKEI